MTVKRIVIAGGPGSGKTTLINHIEKEGHIVMHEISRAVTLAAQAAGIEQLFLTDPLLFSQRLLAGRLSQFEEAEMHSDTVLFYDRGMPDVTAYMDYIGAPYSQEFEAPCYEYQYDAIFLLPPWKGIYQRDNERYESFEQAQIIHDFLLRGYQKYGYEVIDVPVGTIEERTKYIFQTLNHIS